MKVYIATLVLTEHEYKELVGIIDYSQIKYIENGNYYKVLYAQTNKKKLFKKFMGTHTRLKESVMEMTEEEYHDFDLHYKSARISYCKMEYAYEKKISIPMTHIEIIITIDDIAGDAGDNGKILYYDEIGILASIDPRIFKEKYAKTLEDVHYVDAYILFYEDSDWVDQYLYNKSYEIPKRRFNEVGLYCILYKKVLDIDGLHSYLLKEVTHDKS